LLRHSAIETAKAAFDLTQITDFVTKFHINYKSQYLYRNM
jgi:hypothetical protein